MTAPRVATRPAPRRGQAPPAPPLRLVGPARSRHRALTRLATALAAALAGAGMFAVVALHVFLAQGQVELDRLQRRADAETARNGRLKVDVAQLESPARLVGAARDRLGMVPPATVVYLPAADPSTALPPVPAGPPPTTAPASAPATPTTVASKAAPGPTPARTTPTTPTTVRRTTTTGAAAPPGTRP